MSTITEIHNAETHIELDDLVEEYLSKIGETQRARGESYGETAARLGGDAILEAAEDRWHEIGA